MLKKIINKILAENERIISQNHAQDKNIIALTTGFIVLFTLISMMITNINIYYYPPSDMTLNEAYLT